MKELGVSGRACPPILSEKEKKIEKEKKEEMKVNEILKDNGLVQRPVTAKRTYATFEIVEEKFLSQQNNCQRVRLPRVLREKNPNKPNLTSDDIEKKLEKANQRKMVS